MIGSKSKLRILASVLRVLVTHFTFYLLPGLNRKWASWVILEKEMTVNYVKLGCPKMMAYLLYCIPEVNNP